MPSEPELTFKHLGPDANVLPEGKGWNNGLYSRNTIVYNSYAGTDIVAVIVVPGHPPMVLGELQTISYSMHRENTPVRVLGNVNPLGFVKGGRTIAGSLIFTQFNQYAFYRLREYQKMIQESLYPLSDMLPPFDVVLSFANEYASFSKMRIGGVTIVDEGGTMSIDDLMLEQTYCVDQETEILTNQGWKTYDQLDEESQALTLSPGSRTIEWQDIESVHVFDYDGDMVRWGHSRGFEALTTPNHRWLTTNQYQLAKGFYVGDWEFRTTEELSGRGRSIIVSGGLPFAFAETPTFSDELVELIGWAVTEGHYIKAHDKGVHISQSERVNPDLAERLRGLVKHFAGQGATASVYETNRADPRYQGMLDFYFGKGIGEIVRTLAPGKVIPPSFLTALTFEQGRLLFQTLIDADGHWRRLRGENEAVQTPYFIQKNSDMVDSFQMLAAMLGKRSWARQKKDLDIYTVTCYDADTVSSVYLEDNREHYVGKVWCPKTASMTWLARRNGKTFWTGNTFMARSIQPLTTYIPDLPSGTTLPVNTSPYQPYQR